MTPEEAKAIGLTKGSSDNYEFVWTYRNVTIHLKVPQKVVENSTPTDTIHYMLHQVANSYFKMGREDKANQIKNALGI